MDKNFQGGSEDPGTGGMAAVNPVAVGEIEGPARAG